MTETTVVNTLSFPFLPSCMQDITMSGLVFVRAFKRVFSINAARALTASRGTVSADCRCTLVTTTSLESRESDLHKIAGIATHNKPTNLDKKWLVLTRAFGSENDIPATLPQTQIDRARDLARIAASCFMMMLFVLAVPFYVASGRRRRARGDTESKRAKDWVAQLRREKLAQEAAARKRSTDTRKVSDAV